MTIAGRARLEALPPCCTRRGPGTYVQIAKGSPLPLRPPSAEASVPQARGAFKSRDGKLSSPTTKILLNSRQIPGHPLSGLPLGPPLAEAGQDEHDILHEHRTRNRATRPPTVKHLQKHKDLQRCHNNSGDDDDKDLSSVEEVIAVAKRRRTKEPTPSNEGYYCGETLVPVRISKWEARRFVSLYLFPDRQSHWKNCSEMVQQGFLQYEASLPEDTDCDWRDFHENKSGLTQLIWERTSADRSEAKKIAQVVVQKVFSDALDPSDIFTGERGYGQEEWGDVVAQRVGVLLKGSNFHGARLIESTGKLVGFTVDHSVYGIHKRSEGEILSFASEAIRLFLNSWIYGFGQKDPENCLDCKFPQEKFAHMIILEHVAAAVVFYGHRSSVGATVERYNSYYHSVLEMVEDALNDPDTGPKLNQVYNDWFREIMVTLRHPRFRPVNKLDLDFAKETVN
ncbi:hypothetical protein FB451DRAFT_1572445 [Mycena latifolia]|nr:hypothetical protein FB451DRAFT_1572445 [Mycena latifolia]